MPPALILASTSRYRAELLARLALPFDCRDPALPEPLQNGEHGIERARRLAASKAAAVAVGAPDAVVIGSDQVAVLGERILGKPGTTDAAVEQLSQCSGQAVRFHTAVSVRRGTEHGQALDTTTVRFRPLAADAIRRYVAAEPAPDCCGGFKVEGLGVSLFAAVESDDPTALIGLPLIVTADLLRGFGFALP